MRQRKQTTQTRPHETKIDERGDVYDLHLESKMQGDIENDRFQIACCRRRETVAFLYCHQQYNRRRRKMQELLAFFDGKLAQPTPCPDAGSYASEGGCGKTAVQFCRRGQREFLVCLSARADDLERKRFMSSAEVSAETASPSESPRYFAACG